MTKNNLAAIISFVVNFLAALSIISDYAEFGIVCFSLGSFGLWIKIICLFGMSCIMWLFCKDYTIKSPLFVAKISSLFSIICSTIVLIISLVVSSPICEISDSFVIIFSGELGFLNEILEKHLMLLSVKTCFIIYLLGTFFQCFSDIIHTLANKN